MKPAGRLQGAIEILRTILLDEVSPEKALLNWGRAHRFAGASDRRAIHDTVYDVLRYYGTLCAYMQSTEPSHLVAGWLFFIKEQNKSFINSLFDGARHNPRPLPDICLKQLKKQPSLPADFQGRYNIHQGLASLFENSLGADMDSILQCLSQRAPLDMRVNTSITSCMDALETLQESFPDTEFEQFSHIPSLIRCHDHINIKLTDLFQNGGIEIQDGASQYAVHLIADYYQKLHLSQPHIKGRVLDYCAGGGGKSLALADILDRETEIICSDISEIRLKSLKDRAIRAAQKNIRIIASHRLSADKGLFKLVLVDAPCSGSGAWRRNVYDKWRITAELIKEYTFQQAEILSQAKNYVEDQGLLVYMTCSLFVDENDKIIEKFLGENPHFHIYKPSQSEDFAAQTAYGLSLNPYTHQTDGFYIAVLQNTQKK